MNESNEFNLEDTQNVAHYNSILSLEPQELLMWLNETFMEEIPTSVTSIDELKKAGAMLGKLTNIYSYLTAMSLFAKLKVREAKKNKIDKEEIDKCVDRKEIIASFAETVKCQYTAISRMITVKKQIDDEMRML